MLSSCVSDEENAYIAGKLSIYHHVLKSLIPLSDLKYVDFIELLSVL